MQEEIKEIADRLDEVNGKLKELRLKMVEKNIKDAIWYTNRASESIRGLPRDQRDCGHHFKYDDVRHRIVCIHCGLQRYEGEEGC